MPPTPRVIVAQRAMRDIGFPSREVVPILQKLLKACNSNWTHIEENYYEVLINHILEARKVKAAGAEKHDAGDDQESRRKRLRNPNEISLSLMPDSDDPSQTSLKQLKLDAEVSPEEIRESRTDRLRLQVDNCRRAKTISPLVDNGGRPQKVLPQVANCEEMTELFWPQHSSAEEATHDLCSIILGETGTSSLATMTGAAQESAKQAPVLTYRSEKLTGSESSRTLGCCKEKQIIPDSKLQKHSKAVSSAGSKDNEVDNGISELAGRTDMILPHHPALAGHEGSVVAGTPPLCRSSQFSSLILPVPSVDSDILKDKQLAVLGQSLLLSFQLELEKEISLTAKEFAAKVNAIILSVSSLGTSLSSWLPKWQKIEKLLFRVDELCSLLKSRTFGDLERKNFEEVSSELSVHLNKVNGQQKEVEDGLARLVKVSNEDTECEQNIHKLKSYLKQETENKKQIEKEMKGGLARLFKVSIKDMDCEHNIHKLKNALQQETENKKRIDKEVEDGLARLVKVSIEDMECEQSIHKLQNALEQETENKKRIADLICDGLVELGKKEAVLKALADHQEGLERAKDEAKAALDEFLLYESNIKKDIENLEASIKRQWASVDPLDL